MCLLLLPHALSCQLHNLNSSMRVIFLVVLVASCDFSPERRFYIAFLIFCFWEKAGLMCIQYRVFWAFGLSGHRISFRNKCMISGVGLNT